MRTRGQPGERVGHSGAIVQVTVAGGNCRGRGPDIARGGLGLAGHDRIGTGGGAGVMAEQPGYRLLLQASVDGGVCLVAA